MGFFDRLFGRSDRLFERKEEVRAQSPAPTSGLGGGQQPTDADGQALERYRYMLSSAEISRELSVQWVAPSRPGRRPDFSATDSPSEGFFYGR